MLEAPMFVSPAYAQTAAPAAGGDMFMTLLPLLLIFVVFYFLLIRPQQKRAKEHQNMLKGIKSGDQVVTNGGIIGRVAKVEDGILMLDIADGVRVRCQQSMVADLVKKSEPRDDAKK
jgi:preprotein translocase subunit YajC